MIAALYVQTGGVYCGLNGVDPWDEVRDARNYDGPFPVVAHPPCKRWGRFWHGSTRKPHQFQLGADGGCFAAALTAVRNWGASSNIQPPARPGNISDCGGRVPAVDGRKPMTSAVGPVALMSFLVAQINEEMGLLQRQRSLRLRVGAQPYCWRPCGTRLCGLSAYSGGQS